MYEERKRLLAVALELVIQLHRDHGVHVLGRHRHREDIAGAVGLALPGVCVQLERFCLVHTVPRVAHFRIQLGIFRQDVRRHEEVEIHIDHALQPQVHAGERENFLGLRTEGGIFKAGGEAGGPGNAFDSFGLRLPAEAAAAARGTETVVRRPHIGRFAPSMSEGWDLVGDIAVTAAGAGIGRITAACAGGRSHHSSIVVAQGGDGDVLLVIVVIVCVHLAAQAVTVTEACLGTGGFVSLVDDIGIGVRMRGPSAVLVRLGIVFQRVEQAAGVASHVDLRLDYRIGVHEVRLGELGGVADEALLVKVELVRQLIACQVIPSAAEGIALGNLNKQLYQDLQIVHRGLTDAAIPVAVFSQTSRISVIVTFTQSADSDKSTAFLPECRRLIVAHGFSFMGVSAVVDIDLPPAQDLAGIVPVGVFPGDADEFPQQRAHVAGSQIISAVILSGGRFDLRGILAAVHNGGLAVAGEAPFGHGQHGNEVVTVHQVEDAVVLFRGGLGVRGAVWRGEGVGEYLLSVVG